MPFSKEVEAFIRDFVKDLRENTAAVFAGAGMSKNSGFVDWPELLRDIADDLHLDVDREHDLISLAQFHVNELRSSTKLASKIIEEFSQQAEPTETHNILARLPIRTYWTTNYDTLIEDSLKNSFKVPDVKFSIKQLNSTLPKRDAVVYKMHGDATLPSEAVLYKEQYETYYRSHEQFVTALSGDLVSKTFLFIGFSFTDPNLDYVLSRLHTSPRRTHYCFMRRENCVGNDEELAKYKARKQELRIRDLQRFGIQTLLIDDYAEIPRILAAVEMRFLKRTVFISGSAEEFGEWKRDEAQSFIHSLSSNLIRSDFRVVNGFGWGVGSAVINGALEAIYARPGRHSEDQLVMRPFPQYATKEADLSSLWEGYRQRMISLAGIAVFLFGNKRSDDKIVEANGVIREWEIAHEQGKIGIPVGATGYAAKTIAERVLGDPAKYYGEDSWIAEKVIELNDENTDREELASKVVQLIQQLGKVA